MIHFFDQYGRCVLMIDGDQPKDVIEANKKTFGAVNVVECGYVGAYNEICYLGGEVCFRPVNPAIIDGMWLRRVPIPATVYINEAKYSTNEHDIELTFPYPNTYKIRVEAFPYSDANFEVTTT